MLRKETPVWVSVGAFVLAVIGGCINAVALVGVYHQAVSHMSGTTTMIGINLAAGDLPAFLRLVSVLMSFFFGALLSGFIIRQSTLRLGRRYGFVLSVESVLLLAATICLRQNLHIGDYLAAMACGLQNGMATSFSGAIVRTTHVTGIVTDLGIAAGQLLRGQAVEWRRIRLYALLLGGFFLGAYIGARSFAEVGYDTLLFPAALAGCTGLGYWIFKHVQRKQQRAQKTRGWEVPGVSLRRLVATARAMVAKL